MPFYQVEHCIPLDKTQREELANAITHIHTRKFKTPSFFVYVRFTESSDHCDYCSLNCIRAYVRAGENRSKEDFDDLAQQVLAAWNRIINAFEDMYRVLRVLVMGAITTGIESGFRFAFDSSWLEKNMSEFERLVARGDEDFVAPIDKMRNREDLDLFKKQ